jgi:hypothetical protein
MAAQIAQAALAAKRPEGRWASGGVDQVGEHGLDDRVPAMGEIGLDRGFGAVGEERVVAPDREQLLGGGAVPDPAHDHPAP